MTFNVLIIDDHPLIVTAYQDALHYVSKNNEDINFEIETADSCDTAYLKIQKAVKGKKIDIVFLDIKLEPSKDGTILSGEDLGVKIRQLFDDTRIIVATTFNDNFRLNNILKNVDPDAFLVKNDLTPANLIDALKAVLNSQTYYCTTVSTLMRKKVKNNFILDEFDRKLLYEISIGTKMKDLPGLLPFSIAGLERRKRVLKEIFNVANRDDKKLIKLAKEKGFI